MVEHLGATLADAKDATRSAAATGTSAAATEQPAGSTATGHAAVDPDGRTDQEEGREEVQDGLAEGDLVVVRDGEALAEGDAEFGLRLLEPALEGLDRSDAEVVGALARGGAGRGTGGVRVERDADAALVHDGELVDEALAEEGGVELGPGDLAGRRVVLRREAVQGVHGDSRCEDGGGGRVRRGRLLFGRHTALLAVALLVLVAVLAIALVLVGAGSAGGVAGLGLTPEALQRVLLGELCRTRGRGCDSAGVGVVLGVVGRSPTEEAAEEVIESGWPFAVAVLGRAVSLALGVLLGWWGCAERGREPAGDREGASMAAGRSEAGGGERVAAESGLGEACAG